MQESQKAALDKCFVDHGCQSVYGHATPQERERFAQEGKNSTQRIGNAYRGYHDQFFGGVKVAWKEHEERVEYMHEVFRAYFIDATAQLGCDPKCVFEATKGKKQWNNFGDIMPKCGCGRGAWDVKTTDVNVLAATENVYGDLENLNEVDATAIQSALIRLDM